MADILLIAPSGSLTGSKTFAGAKATFFDAGTTTPATVYADEALTVPHASPLLAGADGLWPEIFVGGAAFKAVVTYSDNSTCYTLDPCPKSSALGAAAGSVSFTPTVDLPYSNVQAAIEGVAAQIQTGAMHRLIRTDTLSNQASLTYTSSLLTAPSGLYKIVLDGVVPATSGAFLRLRTSTDNGATFASTAGDYSFAYALANSADSVAGDGSPNGTAISIHTQGAANSSAMGVCGQIMVFGAGQARHLHVTSKVVYERNDGAFMTEDGGGKRNSTEVVNAIRLDASSGNLSTGTVSLYEVIR